MPISRLLIVPVLLICFVLASCGLMGTQRSEAASASQSSAQAGESAGDQPDNSHPAASPSEIDDAVRRMDFWLAIAVTPLDRSEGPTAYQAHGYSVSKLDFDLALAKFLAGRPETAELDGQFRQELDNQLLVLRWIEESGQTKDPAFRAEARRALRESLERLAFERKLRNIVVTPQDVEKFYEAHASRYRTGEKVQVRIILVPTPEEASEIMGLLNSGASFRELAATHSIHESRARQGELEPFERGTYIKAFEDKAFDMTAGEIGSVSTATGTFIIQKLAEIPAQTISFESVRDQLRLELEQQRRQEAIDEFLRQLRAQYGNGPAAEP